GKDRLDDLAHRCVEAAGRIDLQHDQLRALLVRSRDAARHEIRGRRADSAYERKHEHLRRRSLLPARRKCEQGKSQDFQQMHEAHLESGTKSLLQKIHPGCVRSYPTDRRSSTAITPRSSTATTTSSLLRARCAAASSSR